MKSRLLLIFLIFALVLVSCQSNHGDSTSEPNDRTTYHFDSYDDLFASFSADETDNKVQAEKRKWGVYYLAFVYEMTSGNTNIIVPYFDGSVMKLRDQEEYPIITLFTKEDAGLPWIWYHGMYNGSYMRVRIACPLIDIPQNYSASQALYAIDPDVPNTHNFRRCKFRATYKKIYDKNISLKDFDTTAVVFEFKDDPFQKVGIYHNGWFIIIDAPPEILTDTFWKSLSFQ